MAAQIAEVVEMDSEKWEELYVLAATEVDGKKVPERVAAVREAIRARLQELEGNSDHSEERMRVKNTLERLDSLEADAKKW